VVPHNHLAQAVFVAKRAWRPLRIYLLFSW
jgi:hypothetical protein